MKELNLLIIWENARKKEQDIVNDLESTFEVCEIIDADWSKEEFHTNLTRFYGQKLKSGSFKEKHCGNGRFLLVTFFDANPIYDYRPTSRGDELVNINVFDKKLLYRSWTGGGHKIHATNGEHETNHDLLLLLGCTTEEYSKLQFEKRKTKRHLIMPGGNGWSDFNEFFSFLNSISKYIIMRNYEALPNYYDDSIHGDIDFLTNDAQEFVFFANASKLEKPRRPRAYYISIAGRDIPIDVRDLGDGYYDMQWAKKSLSSSMLHKGMIRVPNYENHKFMLLYHALVHKIEISPDYDEFFNISGFRKDQRANILSNFMLKYDYEVLCPSDISVFYNFKNAKKLKVRRRKEPIKVLRLVRQSYYLSRFALRKWWVR